MAMYNSVCKVWLGPNTTSLTESSMKIYIPSEERENNMKKLWKVYVVDPETDAIIENIIVARSRENALIKVFATDKELEKDPDNYCVFVEEVGTLSAVEK